MSFSTKKARQNHRVFFELVFQVSLVSVVPVFGFLPLIIILSAKVLNQHCNSNPDVLSHTFYDLDR